MPDPIWTDPSVSDLAIRVHGFLIAWMRRHPGRFPRTSEIANGIDRAECTVRRAVKSLERAGYIVLGKRSAESRYEASMGYRLLGSPKPKLSAAIRPSLQRELFPDPIEERADVRADMGSSDRESAQTCAPPSIKREKEKTDRQKEVCPSDSFSHEEPDAKSPPPQVLSGEEALEQDHLAELLRRAELLFDTEVDRRKLEARIAVDGMLAVEQVIELAENRIPAPEHWGWVTATLENWAREGKTPKPPKSFIERQSPVIPAIKPLSAADMPSDEDLPATIALAREPGAVGKMHTSLLRRGLEAGLLDPAKIPHDIVSGRPAGGPVGKLTPRPVGDPFPRSLHYTVYRSTQDKESPQE
jgi:hypothetical protein